MIMLGLMIIICIISNVYSLKLLMSSDIASLHSNIFNKIKDKFVLKETFFAEDNGAKEWKNSDSTGKCGWWDEKLGGKLTGVSNYIYTTPTVSSYNINIWLGPSYLVPHCLLSITQSSSGISITSDYVPRGSFPLGSDQTFVDTYYGKESIAIYDANYAIPNTVPLPPSKSFSSRLLNSPLHTSINGLNIESASAIATKHVDVWMNWMDTASKVDARQRGAINTRDDKQRSYFFRSALAEASNFVDKDFASSLAAAHTGPLAEAYVGGGG